MEKATYENRMQIPVSEDEWKLLKLIRDSDVPEKAIKAVLGAVTEIGEKRKIEKTESLKPSAWDRAIIEAYHNAYRGYRDVIDYIVAVTLKEIE